MVRNGIKRIGMTLSMLSLCVAALAGAGDVLAGLTGKHAVPTVVQVCNPKISAGDILLPMPGGLHMVLRPVCVPAGGYLDDVKQQLGVGGGNDGEVLAEAWSDRRYTASVAASFEMSDMPASWDATAKWLANDPASAAGARDGMRAFLYFIGKYEVSRGQWRAVMNSGEQFVMQTGDDRPVTGISWFDAMEFTRRYSEWLMQNHPEALPYFQQENRSSFIRLPTETEWEYAARGGHRVSPVERERTRLHPAPANADMGEYIIATQFDAKLTSLASIGSRKGNPLELYDMLGNCSEMVQTPFQLVAGGQLVGSQGGFVIKGGSWRTATLAGLHPGRRVEADYYIDGEAQKRDDMGFRVSIGTILSPKDRHSELQEEWNRRTASTTIFSSTPQNDVRILIREFVREVDNPELKQKLKEAENIASLYHDKVNASEDKIIHELLIGAAFSLETIANYAARCHQVIKLLESYEILSSQQRNVDSIKISNMNEKIHGFIIGMQGVLHYYCNMLTSIKKIEKKRLQKQFESIRIEFSHNDGFSKNIYKRLDVLERHVNNNNINSIDTNMLSDILPEWIMKGIKKHWIY